MSIVPIRTFRAYKKPLGRDEGLPRGTTLLQFCRLGSNCACSLITGAPVDLWFLIRNIGSTARE